MAQMTITEALAEIKTLGKRIEAKRVFVTTHLARQECFRDPLTAEGGQRTAIASALQSVADLQARIVGARRAIQQANHTTPITVQGVTRTMADWLAWRREVAPGERQFLATLRQQIASVRAEATKKGVTASDGAAAKPMDITINVSETDLQRRSEEVEQILGTLDGQLSLKNATTVVEF